MKPEVFFLLLLYYIVKDEILFWTRSGLFEKPDPGPSEKPDLLISGYLNSYKKFQNEAQMCYHKNYHFINLSLFFLKQGMHILC